MNARGGGHASPPPLSSPPHPASEGLEAHYSTQLGNSPFWGHPNFSGCGTLSFGETTFFMHFEVTKIIHQEVLIFWNISAARFHHLRG